MDTITLNFTILTAICALLLAYDIVLSVRISRLKKDFEQDCEITNELIADVFEYVDKYTTKKKITKKTTSKKTTNKKGDK